MKQLIFLCMLVACISHTEAQKSSCDLAYRFDAAYTAPIDQIESVTIYLYQPKATKEAAVVGKNPGSYYYVQGAASAKQLLSVEANIGFKTCYIMPVMELYKAQVQNGMRTFTIPAGSGGNTSVNIPIQFITPPGIADPNRNGTMNWGKGFFKVKLINGYLAAGEYVLIDKNSLSPDGTQMRGYTFSIK